MAMQLSAIIQLGPLEIRPALTAITTPVLNVKIVVGKLR